MLWSRTAFVLVSTLLSTAPLAAQNPWAVVPAFPTVCYTKGDPFPNQIEAARSANTEAEVRQKRINGRLDGQADALDGHASDDEASDDEASDDEASDDEASDDDAWANAVAPSWLIAYQKKNPGGFRKYLQFVEQGNQAVGTAHENHRLRKSQFKKEFDTLLANYEAAHKTTMDPLRTRMWKVIDPFSGASHAEMIAVVAKYNSTYEMELCEMWIIGGKFPAFLTKFKAYLVGTYLPSMEIQAAMDKAELEIKGISTKDYQATEPFDAVNEYIVYVQAAYGLRWGYPQGL